MIKKFTSNLAFELATPASFERGEEYFKDGAVIKVWQENNRYKAIVDGTRRYHVSISIEDNDVNADCSCPYDFGGICKHIVATIFTLSDDPKLSLIDNSDDVPEEKENEKETAKLLTQANKTQIKNFLKKILTENRQTRADLKIFLQGPKETGTTAKAYRERIKYELDGLDLDDLYEAWQYSGDDYYDNYYGESEYDEDAVGAIVEPYMEKAQKYLANKNYGESIKICQAIIDALVEKEKIIEDDYADLSDWFINEAHTALKFITEILKEAGESKFSKPSIEYFCRLFIKNGRAIGQGNIFEELKQIVVNKAQAKIALKAISEIKNKKKPENTESSLLAHLYFLAGDDDKFEKISLSSFLNNPSLALDLLKHYKKQKRKADILKTAYRVLEKFEKQASSDHWYDNYDNRNIEIDIRRFLKSIFDPVKEYGEIIKNLEFLFLISAELRDYKELAGTYRQKQEKEKFLEKMEKYFSDQQDVKTMFKVFNLENKKDKILGLIRKHKEAYIFPEMIDAVARDYPKECFKNYQAKIKNMLTDANVKIYPQAAYHLKRMKNIDLDKEFNDFVSWLRSFYSRRYRFIEELDKKGLG